MKKLRIFRMRQNGFDLQREATTCFHFRWQFFYIWKQMTQVENRSEVSFNPFRTVVFHHGQYQNAT